MRCRKFDRVPISAEIFMCCVEDWVPDLLSWGSLIPLGGVE
jgi:hypothetical protein